MLKDILQAILINPANAQHFTPDEAAAIQVIENVPILLLKNTEATIETNAALHNELGSSFNYADHYEKDAQAYDYFGGDASSATRLERNYSRQTITSKIPASANLILDVGCGDGWVAKTFLQKNKKVISMDISTANPIRVLKENPSDNHAAVVADVFHLPFAKNSFDAIIASEIIEHVYDPKLFIEKLVAVLKPGGKLILATPYNETLVYHLCVHCNKPTPANAHLHSFNEKNIIHFFPDQGIEFSFEKLINNYALKIRFYNLVKFLPYTIWKLLDKLFNKIMNKPRLFIITVTKLS
ncbi:class I SAM-dependent methyltransferase [Ferruginibacter sp. SUN002]|uniref:class I SAM-dependent methyltransferase n=1 Tax=Ferruginibacter sp. SUN002 TaxID=2937789 RepID=UPI003D36AE24